MDEVRESDGARMLCSCERTLEEFDSVTDEEAT